MHTILGLRFITPSVFVLRAERKGLEFVPGQHILAGRGSDMREYSLFSGTGDPWIEILVKRIDGGAVSPMLASLEPGDRIDIEGPKGDFVLPEQMHGHRLLFVATGTGIAPYRCFIRSVEGLEYRVLHGVRRSFERYAHLEFPRERYTACLSGEDGGDFHGRVTARLLREPVSPDTDCYLCGNSAMIYEAFRILSGYGVPRSRIHAEIYF